MRKGLQISSSGLCRFQPCLKPGTLSQPQLNQSGQEDGGRGGGEEGEEKEKGKKPRSSLFPCVEAMESNSNSDFNSFG